ncbi:YesL family protein [Oceanobacillus caeni]|uniref:YesL family protein n=1 Tax=Oceanobacillus caeni TaxID=405946 RepID=UPI001FD238AA|nr:YesL family protein [Oceanobacillus caeni]
MNEGEWDMYANGFVSTLDRIATWITRMALLNLLWVLYSLLGLLIAGVFPATIATLGVVRKWMMGEQDIKIWKTFRKIYKQEFTSGNGLGWVLTGIGGVLYLNYKAIQAFGGQLSFIVPFAFYLLLFLYTIIIIWSFPLKAHYHAGVFQHIKNALVIGITKIRISIATIITLFAVVYLSLEIPTLILFFIFSLSALIWFWFSFRIFITLDRK